MKNRNYIIELGKYDTRDILFLSDYFVNPYINCDFNCVYCYVKTDPILEKEQDSLSEEELFSKFEQQLEEESRKKEFGFIAISPATDPYQNIEKNKKRTKKLLSIIEPYHFPVHIMTKSTLVSRDINILAKINEISKLPRDLKQRLKHKTIVTFSFSTADEKIAKIFEPYAPSPVERFRVMQKCNDAGLLTGIAISPVLPYISDTINELEMLVKNAKEFGAEYIIYNSLMLFEYTKERYYAVLDQYFKKFVLHYNALFGIYDPTFDLPILRYHQPPKPLSTASLYIPSSDYDSDIKRLIQKLCKDYKINFGIL